MEVMSGTLVLIAPELIVAATGALVLVIDLIARPQAPDATPAPKPWVAAVGLVGLALAAIATIRLSGVSTTLFDGVVVLDQLTVFFRLLFIAVASVVIAASVGPLVRFTRWHAEFGALVLWCTVGHMLLAASGELFTIFIALQLTSLPLIALIGLAKSDPRSGEASLKYLLLVLVSTAVLLYGMTLIYGALGTSTISEIGELLKSARGVQPALALGLVLLLTGFAFKITAVPFHYWVPDVYQGAPTPVSAFLSVGSKFAGFALALRIIVTGLRAPIDHHLLFAVMAALSMTFGNLAAIRQTDAKRMLAYSGIAQAGYLLVGLAALTERGVAALLFYAIAYSAANLLSFVSIMAVEHGAGSTRIEVLAGLARTSPALALALTTGLLSLAGLPLLGGFIAKFAVFLAAAEDPRLVWVVAVAVVNSVISLYYYLRVVWQLWVAEPATATALENRIGERVALIACAALVVISGVAPEPLLRASAAAARALFGG